MIQRSYFFFLTTCRAFIPGEAKSLSLAIQRKSLAPKERVSEIDVNRVLGEWEMMEQEQ